MSEILRHEGKDSL